MASLRVASRVKNSSFITKKYNGNSSLQNQFWRTNASGQRDVSSELDFSNHETAFASKSTWEIIRALSVLQLCSFNSFVNNSSKWFEFSQAFPLIRTLTSAFVRATFYAQFVGGSRDDDIASIVTKISAEGIKPMLVCTMEEDVGQEQSKQEGLYDRNLERVIGCLRLANNFSDKMPCVQLKMTSLFSADVLERLSKIYKMEEDGISMVESCAEFIKGNSKLNFQNVSQSDLKHLERGIERIKEIGKIISTGNIRLLVDAEFSYVNPALSLVTLAMMTSLNQSSPTIWNTFQCYLKETPRNIQKEKEIADHFGVCFGGKLVRGAYITTEKKWAIEKGMPDPVCESYTETNDNYNKCLEIFTGYVKEMGPRCSFVAATHNEDSIHLLLGRMNDMGLKRNDTSINFAQLYGMCDQVTYTLGNRGYNVYKSIPVGPLMEAIPYLARRATENQSVLAGARKEQEMLRKAFRKRIMPRLK